MSVLNTGWSWCNWLVYWSGVVCWLVYLVYWCIGVWGVVGVFGWCWLEWDIDRQREIEIETHLDTVCSTQWFR